MRLIILIIVALLVGGLVGGLLAKDPGYVLLAYDHWSIETSLWLFLIAWVFTYFLFRLSVQMVLALNRGQRAIGTWSRQRHAKNARTQMVKGLLLLSEGRWEEARKQLLKNVGYSDTPLVNYLAAACAANAQGLLELRDSLLQKADTTTPGSHQSVALVQAQLQIRAEQWEQALATLVGLREVVPEHPLMLKFLAQCYRQLGDAVALWELLPVLRRYKVLPAEELVNLEAFCCLSLLRDEKFLSEAGGAEKLWRKLSKDLRADEAFIARVAPILNQSDAAGLAERIVKEQLNRSWNDELILVYGQLLQADAEKQLVTAESWLKQRPNSAALLLTLGRLSMRIQAWAKAREYFEASLRICKGKVVYAELGRLCLAMGDSSRGAEYLAKALELQGLLLETQLPNR